MDFFTISFGFRDFVSVDSDSHSHTFCNELPIPCDPAYEAMEDFPTSPAKRQRTDSPNMTHAEMLDHDGSDFYDSPQRVENDVPSRNALEQPSALHNNQAEENTVSIPGLNEPTLDVEHYGAPGARETGDETGILDALLQHVESESRTYQSTDQAQPDAALSTLESLPSSIRQSHLSDGTNATTVVGENSEVGVSVASALDITIGELPSVSGPAGNSALQINSEGRNPPAAGQHEPEALLHGNAFFSNQNAQTTVSEPGPISSTEDFVIPPIGGAVEQHAEQSQVEAEWEMDSSPLESSSDSDTSTDTLSSDDSDDDNEGGGYEMLGPEEQARILMQGEGGSDDEDGKSRDKGEGAPLRTTNEKEEEIIPKPQITLTTDMGIEELGAVECVVENTVLVKAKVSGEYQVLETGSLLCTKDRTVVGVVAETLGRVEQPMYTIRFTNEESVEEAGLSIPGAGVYYVPQHSTFVFTQPLRGVKGSDASNFHDEEVGDDEMEFSDDEAELEHRRKLKLKRKGISIEGDIRGRGRGRGARGGQSRGDGIPQSHGRSHQPNDAAYGNGSLEMNYDDMDLREEGYTPLARPSNYQELVSQGSAPLPNQANPHDWAASRGVGHGHRGHRGDRFGRGGRGRGRGRGRGNERFSTGSDRRQSYSNDFSGPSTAQMIPSSPPSYGNFNNPPSSSPVAQFPPPQFPYQYAQQQYPPAPTLPAQPSHPNFPFTPSPISPLPKQHFNFGNMGLQPSHVHTSPYQSQSHPPTSYPPMPSPGTQPTYPPPGSFAPNHNQQQQYDPQMNPMPWAGNQAAVAEVQRRLEEMRGSGSS